ncbi:hypothetical protein D1007_33067 [Hordeum vulgare]|nr:hypothetical protein D1007_33067 [Hordeum vulgare]
MKKLVVLSVLVLLSLVVVSSAEEFDFFYLVPQLSDSFGKSDEPYDDHRLVSRRLYVLFQWPGSFCDTKTGWCFPGTGKPVTDFGIHGMWPNYSKCKTQGVLDGVIEMVTKGKKKCRPEFGIHGMWPLQLWEKGPAEGDGRQLAGARVQGREEHPVLDPRVGEVLNMIVSFDSETYFLIDINDTIKKGVGFMTKLESNQGITDEAQLYRVYHCVDR